MKISLAFLEALVALLLNSCGVLLILFFLIGARDGTIKELTEYLKGFYNEMVGE